MAVLLIAVTNYFGLLHGFPFLTNITFFTPIHFSFTILLLIEMAGLLFVIPQSLANSIAKQFEILCLILLRSALKEFSLLELSGSMDIVRNSVLKMLADSFSALIVFLLLGYYYNVQKHRPIVIDAGDRERFVLFKKFIGLCMLLSMIVFGVADLYHFWHTGIFTQSFSNFYLVLIIGDLFLMLIAYRYVIHFPDVFRYSAFILATIFIRLSLTAPVYFNGLLAIVSALYAIGVVYFHNLFLEGRQEHLIKKQNQLSQFDFSLMKDLNHQCGKGFGRRNVLDMRHFIWRIKNGRQFLPN